MTLQTYCDQNGIGYTLRPATETENALLTLDGQYLALRCFQEFDPNAEIDEEIGDWLKISDTLMGECDGGEQVDEQEQEEEEDIIDHAVSGRGGLFRR